MKDEYFIILYQRNNPLSTTLTFYINFNVTHKAGIATMVSNKHQVV